jgi:hypothetical protein
MTSFGGEVKPLVPCRKILRHVKQHYGMTEILRRQNSRPFLRQASPASLLNVSTGNFQRLCLTTQNYNKPDGDAQYITNGQDQGVRVALCVHPTIRKEKVYLYLQFVKWRK